MELASFPRADVLPRLGLFLLLIKLSKSVDLRRGDCKRIVIVPGHLGNKYELL